MVSNGRLTHCRLIEFTHTILEDSNSNFRYVMLCDLDISREKTVELFENSGDPDQMPHSSSNLGLHCLPIYPFRADYNGLRKFWCFICKCWKDDTILFISHHAMVVRYYGIPFRVCSFVRTSFPDNSSYSFHQIPLKLGGQLNQEVMQCILHCIIIMR